LIHPEAQELHVFDGGFLQRVQQGAVEEAVDRQLTECRQLGFGILVFLLEVEDLLWTCNQPAQANITETNMAATQMARLTGSRRRNSSAA
jgi:hypothetical protein